MIIEQIVGNVREQAMPPKHIERVYLRSDELLKKIQRVRTDHGNELGIRLKGSVELMDGDILFQDERNSIIVTVLAEEVIVIKPSTIKEMGEIAHQLGNRHLPAQFAGEEMIVQYDYLVEQLLEETGISFSREKRQLERAFRHIGHSHD